MVGGTRRVMRAALRISAQVITPTASVSGWIRPRLRPNSQGATCWRKPSIASSWENRIRSAAAFWKPASTGAGMYLTRLPRRRAPNNAWNNPASKVMNRASTNSVMPDAPCKTGKSERTRLCSTSELIRNVTMLRGE